MLIERLGRTACVALLALIPTFSRGDLIDFDSQGFFGPSAGAELVRVAEHD
jgi:hypothetical protein